MLGGLPRTLFACCKLSNLPYDADGAALEQWLVLPAFPPCLSVTGQVKSQAWVLRLALTHWIVIARCNMISTACFLVLRVGGRGGEELCMIAHTVCSIWLAVCNIATAQA